MKKPYTSWIKICALMLLFFINRDYLSGEPSLFMPVNLDLPSKTYIAREVGGLLFPIVWIGSAASIILSPFLSMTILRLPLTFIFLLSWVANIVILQLLQTESVAGVPKATMIDSGTLAFFWAERRKLPEAIQGYSEVMIPATIAFAAFWLIFAWKPSPKLSIVGKWTFVVCLPIAMALAMAFYSKGGTSTFPTPVGLPIRGASAIAYVTKQDEFAERFHARSVTLRPEKQRFNKIIVIMDESVRAGFVDSRLRGKWGLIDYGATVSTANCSAVSRFIFKRGLNPEVLPQVLVPYGLASEEPTLWQFAKTAGFKTIYIDAVFDTPRHDGINSDELSYIDEKHYIHATLPLYMRDFEALKQLMEVISRPGRAFIVLDKQGVHHTYQSKYPPNEGSTFEGPAVKSPQTEDLREYQRDLVARYNKAVDWAVNRFLSELFTQGLPDDTLLIYTSDHGQSLVENGSKWTHCSWGENTVNGEGLVPLLVYSRGDPPFSRLLRENGENFNGRYSHFQVFPTILLGLGYPVDIVKQMYGGSLLDPPPPTRKFLKGNDVRKMEWHTVD